jgi:uncharacterized membrane protein YgaE (UPF0421/DUF939 family)
MSNYIIELVIGCVVALISYFLKRTMDQVDKTTSKVYQTANELRMLERTFELKHDNLGKQMEKLTESLNKLTDKIDLLNETVHELKYK